MTQKNVEKQPDFEPSLKTVPMPADTNANGDIFGGWILSQMDIAGAICAVKHTKTRVTTVGIEAMSFHKPIFVGDVVSLYTTIEKIGNTSIAIKIESWVFRRMTQETIKVTEGIFTYVSLDQNGNPCPIQSKDTSS